MICGYLVLGGGSVFISFWFFLFGGLMKFYDYINLFDYNLMNWGGFNLCYEFLVDWVSCEFMGVVFLIGGSVIIYSKGYMEGDLLFKRFLMLVMLFILSSLFMVMGGGLISVMLGWDGLGLMSYLLVIYYQGSISYKSGMITILSNRVGDVSILIMIGLLLSHGGSWSYLSKEWGELSVFLMVAACTKSAQVPFSAWLPEAMAAPTPVSSLVHSSTLVTAGIFLLLRLEDLLSEGGLICVLEFLSIMTMLLAGSNALLEMDMKKVVAMSTLSQLGLMMFMLSNGLWMVVYFHMIMHAFFKALMFMCVGVFLKMGGDQDIRYESGKFKVSFLVNQGLLISVLCLGGFPFFCGFFSKDMMLGMYMMLMKGLINMGLFIVGFGFSIFYGMRLYMKGMVMVGSMKVYGCFKEEFFMNFGIFVLMLFSLIMGSIYSWLEGNLFIISLSMEGMLVGLMMMVFGMIMSFWVLVFGLLNINMSEGGKILNFISSNGNFGLLSGKFGEMIYLKEGMIEDDNDQIWVEEIGMNMIKKSLESVFSLYYLKKVNFFTLLISFFLLVVLLI